MALTDAGSEGNNPEQTPNSQTAQQLQRIPPQPPLNYSTLSFSPTATNVNGKLHEHNEHGMQHRNASTVRKAVLPSIEPNRTPRRYRAV